MDKRNQLAVPRARLRERIPAIRSRSRSVISPSSSTIAPIKAAGMARRFVGRSEIPQRAATLAHVSAPALASVKSPGPSRPAGLSNGATLAQQFAGFFPIDTHTSQPAGPGLRNGPTMQAQDKQGIAAAVFAFFRAVHNSPSLIFGCSTSARKSSAKSGIHHRLARQRVPRRNNQPLRTPCRQQVGGVGRAARPAVSPVVSVRPCALFFAPPVPESALAFSVAYSRRRLWILVWHMALLRFLVGRYGTRKTSKYPPRYSPPFGGR